MTPLDLLALALAARAVLDVWFDEDSVLADPRARTQLWQSWFWRTLFNCRFCMSYWVPAGLLGFFVASLFLPDPWAVVAKLPIYGLAATALVWLIDWTVKDRPRTLIHKTDGVELRHNAEVSVPTRESGGASTEDDDERPADPDAAPAHVP